MTSYASRGGDPFFTPLAWLFWIAFALGAFVATVAWWIIK